MARNWVVNLCPFLHFDNSRTNDYEHNISIASWNIKNVIDFLEADESHKFCLDQVSMLEGFQRLFPNYWDSLKQHILEGRIEIVGGTYVLPDFIIPDGESIVRQFLYGFNFIRSEFGIDLHSGWAIDSSGHCSQLPQILRQCGIDTYFIWQGMPYDSPSEFVWKGLDGSFVNVVWLTQGYNCAAWLSEETREAFSRLFEIVNNAGARATSRNIFLPVGGELVPPPPHLADILRTWNKTFPDMRATIVTPQEFAEKLKAVQSKLVTLSGPLNAGRFAPIRSGSLSSRIELKIMTRRLETLLYLVELYLAISGVTDKNTEVENLWRILLFNLDHNIIRGTLADGPYKQAIRRYQQAIKRAQDLLETVVTTLVANGSDSEDTRIVVFNPLPWTRSGLIRVPIDSSKLDSNYFELHDSNGQSVPYQFASTNGDTEPKTQDILFIAKDIPSLGQQMYHIVHVEEPPEFENPFKSGDHWIENDHFIIEFDTFSGAVSRIFDKKNHFEVLRSYGNFLTFENDVGDLYRADRSRLTTDSSDITSLRTTGKLKILESGPVRAVAEVTGEIAGSHRTQRIHLYREIDRIDFVTELDFRGQDKRVCITFPLTIFNNSATIGVPFGAEKRLLNRDESGWIDPSHGWNDFLDWVDCEGPRFGVAMFAFGLHEFAFRDGNLKLTLLRSVDHLSRGLDDEVVETPAALERGKHTFKYSLFSHSGNWQDAKVWQRATEFRIPMIALPNPLSKSETAQQSFLSIEGLNLALSSLKPTDTSEEIVLRFFEPEGRSGIATLHFHRELQQATLVDLLEREVGTFPVQAATVSVPVDAHSILTLRVKFSTRKSEDRTPNDT